MVLSKEAVQVIETLSASKRAATEAARENAVQSKDPLLSQIEGI